MSWYNLLKYKLSKTLYPIFFSGTRFFVILLLLVVAVSCENKIEVINMLTKEVEIPTLTVENSEMIISDSGLLKVKISAPEIQRYSSAEKPYVSFPKGIKAQFFNKFEQLESQITANEATYFEKDRLWEAHGNVVCTNVLKGEQLNSEELYWDEGLGKIYSKKFTRITSADGIFSGNAGFESDQNFNRWKLIGSSGIVNVKDDE